MGGGNGAKAASKRARNVEKGPAEAKSQLKSNEKAMDIQCQSCKQQFLTTTRAQALKEHVESRHPKSTMEEMFPGFVETDKKADKKKDAGKDGDKKPNTNGKK